MKLIKTYINCYRNILFSNFLIWKNVWWLTEEEKELIKLPSWEVDVYSNLPVWSAEWDIYRVNNWEDSNVEPFYNRRWLYEYKNGTWQHISWLNSKVISAQFLKNCIGYNDETYLYCSCDKDSSWVVNRYNRSTQVKTVADISNNSDQTDKPSDLATLQWLTYN